MSLFCSIPGKTMENRSFFSLLRQKIQFGQFWSVQNQTWNRPILGRIPEKDVLKPVFPNKKPSFLVSFIKHFTNFTNLCLSNDQKKASKCAFWPFLRKKFVQNHFLDLSRKSSKTLQNPSFKLRKWDSGRFTCFQASKSRFRTSSLDLTQT